MPLVDMKLPKQPKEKPLTDQSVSLGQDKYPYGLQLRFGSEQISKLSALKDLDVGDEVFIEAKGAVTMVRMSERQGEKPDQSIEIQLKKVAIENQDSQKKQIKEMVK